MWAKPLLIVAAFSAAILFARHGGWGYAGAFLLAVWTQHALAEEVHDGVHYRLADSYRVNEAMAGIYAALLGIGLAQYRRDHVKHHRYFGKPMDPDYAKYATCPKGVAGWARYFAVNFSGYGALRRIAKGPSGGGVKVIVAQGALAVIGGLTVTPLWYPLLWFAPLVTVAYGLTQFRTLLEHWSPNGGRLYNLTGIVSPHLLAAPFGYNYHGAHHENGAIPNYELRYAPTSASAARTMSFPARLKEVMWR